MSSLIRAKTLAAQLALLSTGLVVYSNPLFAAEPYGDARMNAKDLLSETVSPLSKTYYQPRTQVSLDAQEQARRLILGSTRGAAITEDALAPAADDANADSKAAQVYADSQESARRMILGLGSSAGSTSTGRSLVSLTQEPLVIRLNKDEFLIAFGVDAKKCGTNGCNGVISSRVEWKAEDSTIRSTLSRVTFTAPAGAARTIAVDHQHLKGNGTTQILTVSVEGISSTDTQGSRAAQAARTQGAAEMAARTIKSHTPADGALDGPAGSRPQKGRLSLPLRIGRCAG